MNFVEHEQFAGVSWKQLLSTSLFVMMLFAGFATQAQTKKHNYIILLKQVAQYEIVFRTAEELSVKDGDKHGDFQALICGKEVTELTNHQKMAPYIQRAKEAGVSLVACGFSLDMFKVDPSTLPKEIKVVENGLLYDIGLQKKGYINVSL